MAYSRGCSCECQRNNHIFLATYAGGRLPDHRGFMGEKGKHAKNTEYSASGCVLLRLLRNKCNQCHEYYTAKELTLSSAQMHCQLVAHQRLNEIIHPFVEYKASDAALISSSILAVSWCHQSFEPLLRRCDSLGA